MLSGLDREIVGVNVAGCDALCLPCAAKRLGEPRCARVIAGLEDRRHLEWGAPEPINRYNAEDWAQDNAEECNCEREVPLGEVCENCWMLCCPDCGKRLDEPPKAEAAT